MIQQRLAGLLRFLGRVLAKSHRDEVGLRASALAFSTVIAAVPLLAGITIFVARTLREDDGRILDLLAQLLPYQEEAVLTALRSFLTQASSVSGIAVFGFVVTASITFFGVQESLFRIFEVERAPSLARRLVTFSLLFFWGPLLVGTAQAGLLVLREANPEFAGLMRDSILLSALPALVTFLGLSMLYWRAAFRKITLRDAAIGGATATILLELLKLLFGIYARGFTDVQRAVYGSFAIALFSVLSIQLAWYILLISAEISACLSARAPAESRLVIEPDPWIGLGALELLGARGRPKLGADALAPHLGVAAAELTEHLAPLVQAGWLEASGGYRLALSTRRIRIAAVLAAYRRHALTDAGALPANAAALRIRLRQALEFDVGDETLADLLQLAESGDQQAVARQPSAAHDPEAPEAPAAPVDPAAPADPATSAAAAPAAAPSTTPPSAPTAAPPSKNPPDSLASSPIVLAGDKPRG